MEKHPPAPPTGASYVAWLLRVWREGDHSAWHASLQPIDGGTPVGFADLEQLFAYLSAFIDGGAEGRGARPADIPERRCSQ